MPDLVALYGSIISHPGSKKKTNKNKTGMFVPICLVFGYSLPANATVATVTDVFKRVSAHVTCYHETELDKTSA